LQRRTWHHLAYVADVAEERLYVDGMLVASRVSAGLDIGDSSAPAAAAAIGAIQRDDVANFIPSFRGALDTFRISTEALYSGERFELPAGDLSATASTVLLYNFNEPPGAAVIEDLSGNGVHGTPGAGFEEATSPQLGGVYPSVCDGELTGDAIVDGTDLGLLLGAWGACSP
jgi:hypothetical protein